MMSTEQDNGTTTNGLPDTATRRNQRLMAVLVTVGATVIAWFFIEVVGNVDLRSPGFEGYEEGRDVGIASVILTSGAASLAAWGLLAATERWTTHSRRIWLILVAAIFLLSLGGPFSGTGLDTGDRWWLFSLHIVTAAVLIPALYRTIPKPPTQERT